MVNPVEAVCSDSAAPIRQPAVSLPTWCDFFCIVDKCEPAASAARTRQSAALWHDIPACHVENSVHVENSTCICVYNCSFLYIYI